MQEVAYTGSVQEVHVAHEQALSPSFFFVLLGLFKNNRSMQDANACCTKTTKSIEKAYVKTINRRMYKQIYRIRQIEM